MSNPCIVDETFALSERVRMAAYCPIGSASIDQTIVRGVAFLVLCSISLFLACGFDFILVYLVFDFFMRGFVSRNLSLFVILVGSYTRFFSCRTEAVNAAPKVFAARIGFIMSLLILLCNVSELQYLVYVLGGFLLLASALESFFSICLGCHIYALINREWMPQVQNLDE